MPREATVAYRVTVTGRVQGVGFRAWTQWTAHRLGVNGWVKNTWAGTVDAFVEGPESAVNALLNALETGPSMARVENIQKERTTPQGYAGFD